MRLSKFILPVALFTIAVSTIVFQVNRFKNKQESGLEIGTADDPYARQNWERMRMVDPVTQEIPENIFAREAEFVSSLPANQSLIANKRAGQWRQRGPHNIGGRTRAIAFDVDKLSRASTKLFAVYVDFDANSSEWLNTKANNLEFDLYPNPAENKIWLEFENETQENVVVEIFDETGKVVFTDSTTKTDFKANTRNLNRGTYLVIVRKGKEQMGKVLWKY